MSKSVQQVVQKYWGFDALRPLQQQAVDSALAGKDTVVLMPTGGGKSLCYQLPALVMDGLVVVVSPLISLMQDQVEQLKKRNIKAIQLSGNLKQRELDRLLMNAAYGDYKLVYISPERLKQEWILDRLANMNVSLVAVDEAHCISQWGYDFRPSYLELKLVRKALPETPFMALTASATQQVLGDISKELLLRDPQIIRASFYRPNLKLNLIETERKEARCLALLNQSKGTTIIYLRSRKGTEQLAGFLNKSGIKAAFYHAGMAPAERQQVQQRWMRNAVRIMVATTAFGMGVDKADVRMVMHLDLPDSPESYYQEIGRAGRDGQLADCYLFFSKADQLKLETNWKDTPDLEEIKKIYHAYFSDQKVAIGAGKFIERPLHIYSFSSKYKFSSRHVHQAFTALDRMGFVRYEDVSNRPSSVLFKLKGDELYSFQVKNPSLEPVSKALLRLYGGITEYRSNISEELVSRKTGIPVFKVIEHIEILAKRGVLIYKRHYKGTTVVLLTERLPDSHLRIKPELLKLRKENNKKRAEAMLQLATNSDVCRMQQLVNYFGENIERKCGICDACTSQNESGIKEQILARLAKSDLSATSLVELFPTIPSVRLAEIINTMLDDGVIVKSKNQQFTRPNG